MKLGYISTYTSGAYLGPIYGQLAELSKKVDVSWFASRNSSYQYTTRSGREKDEDMSSTFHIRRFGESWHVRGIVWPKDLVGRLKQEKIDVVHSNEYYQPISWQSVKYAREANVPFVFTQRRPVIPGGLTGMQLAILGWMGRNVIRHAAHITSNTALGKQLLVKRFNVEPDKVTVIPTSVQTERFADADGSAFRQKYGIADDEFVIMHIGRIFPIKRIDLLVRAYSRMKKDVPKARLVIIGPEHPEEGPKVRKIAEELGVRPLFIGGLPNEQVPAALAACDVFALTSEFEGFSYSLVEASAAGKPLMSFAVGGNVEIIDDGVNGFLVPWCDIDRYAGRLVELAKNPDLRRSLGNAAQRKAVERYSVQKCAAEFERIYRRVL